MRRAAGALWTYRFSMPYGDRRLSKIDMGARAVKNDGYVGPRTLRLLGLVTLLVGTAALVAAAVLMARAFTTELTTLELPVELGDGTTAEQATAYLQQHNPHRAAFTADNSGLWLSAPDPTRSEVVHNALSDVLLCLTIALGAFLLRPILTSIAAGSPFGSHNARRLGILAGVTALASLVVPALPKTAAIRALDRLDLTGPDSPFLFGASLALTPPILFALVLLLLAEAFRHGERLQRDVEGLV